VHGVRVLRLTIGKQLHLYLLRPVKSQIGGAGWRVEKLDGGDAYHVLLNGRQSTCECLGHLRHGHKTLCKHVAALAALTAAGKLS
jgi:hypothetical protein